MPRDLPEMDIRTTIVAGDYDSFRAALTRSIIGVTFKKFKRLGARFYATKADNVTIVDATCKRFYEELQHNLPNVPLKHLRIATAMRLKWDRDGRILDLSNVRVSVYQAIGELSVASANIVRRSQRVKVDFFYSSVDFQSQTAKKELDLLEQEIGREYFERRDHDFLNPTEKKIADKMRVKGVPAVVFNDGEPLENPSKMSLTGKLNELLAPYVNATDSKFTFELTLGPIQKTLEPILKPQ
jgi:hypothetical protein